MKNTKRNRDKKITFALFTIPGLLLYLALYIYPLLLGGYYSLTDWNGISPSFKIIGFKNFAKVFSDKRFRSAMFFNIRYSIGLILCVVSLALIIALLLNQKIKFRSGYRALYFIPAVLSGLTVGLIFNQIFYRVIPSIGKALNIEFLSKNLLANPDMAFWVVLFVGVWICLPIPTVLFLSGLQTIPEDLMEAAMLDGANAWQRFKSITVPFLLPVLSVILVMVTKSGLMAYDHIKSLTNGGPAGKTESIAILIYQHGFVENKYSYSIAEAIVAGLIICIISAIQIYYTNKKKVD